MNCLLGFLILAKRGDSDFSWVVPVVFVVIWILGGIGKVFGAYREDRKRHEQQGSGDVQENKMRYEPISDVSAPSKPRSKEMAQAAPIQQVREKMPADGAMAAKPERKRTGTVASLKKAMLDVVDEAYAQQGKSQIAKPVAAKPTAGLATASTQRKATREMPVVSLDTNAERAKVSQPKQQETILSDLWQKENIRKAIIYSEIIGKPISLRN